MTTLPAPKPPPRAVVATIISRYLKETPKWDARREFPLFYGLWKVYPDVAFWTKHELGYRLNSLAHFLTPEGKARLQTDHRLFHFTLDTPPEVPHTDESDTLPPPPAPVFPAMRPRTMAEYLKTS